MGVTAWRAWLALDTGTAPSCRRQMRATVLRSRLPSTRFSSTPLRHEHVLLDLFEDHVAVSSVEREPLLARSRTIERPVRAAGKGGMQHECVTKAARGPVAIDAKDRAEARCHIDAVG